MGRLDGKVALISGVARGQGRAHAQYLSAEGAAIIGFDAICSYTTVPFSQANRADLDETVALIERTGGQIYVGRADVRNRAEISEVVEAGVSAFGDIDIVVCNAGIGIKNRPFWKIPEDDWKDVIDVNLTGVWHTASAAMPSMLSGNKGGSIIITGSAAAAKAAPNLSAYTAAKTGIIGLMRSMAADLAPYGIRVNVVSPTCVATDFILNNAVYRGFRPDLDMPTVEDVKPVMVSLHPLGEPWIETRDVVHAVAYLASNEARGVTGIVLPLDLGHSFKF